MLQLCVQWVQESISEMVNELIIEIIKHTLCFSFDFSPRKRPYVRNRSVIMAYCDMVQSLFFILHIFLFSARNIFVKWTLTYPDGTSVQ